MQIPADPEHNTVSVRKHKSSTRLNAAKNVFQSSKSSYLHQWLVHCAQTWSPWWKSLALCRLILWQTGILIRFWVLFKWLIRCVTFWQFSWLFGFHLLWTPAQILHPCLMGFVYFFIIDWWQAFAHYRHFNLLLIYVKYIIWYRFVYFLLYHF